MRQFHYIFVTFLVLIFHSSSGLSQGNLVLDYDLDVQDGVSEADIAKGFHTEDGQIWFIHSDGGISIYDGSTVSVLEDKLIKNGREIRAIPSPDNMIWIASKHLGENTRTLIVLDPISKKTTPFSDYYKNKFPFSLDEVVNVFPNVDGTLWITTLSKKLYEFNGKDFRLWIHQFDFRHKLVQKISDTLMCYLDSRTSILQQIIQNKKGQKLLSQKYENVVARKFLPIITTNEKGIPEIYFEVEMRNTNYVVLVKSSIERPYHSIDSMINEKAESNYYSNGTSFFKIASKKLSVFNANFQLIYHKDLLEDMNLVFADHQNGAWLSKGRGQISRVYPNKIRFKLYQNYIADKAWYRASRGISDGVQNDLFMAQGGAIAHIASNGKVTFVHRKTNKEFTLDYFGMYLQKDKKILWVTDGPTISQLDPKTLEFLSSITIPDIDIVWQPYEDKKKRVWFGSSNGLYFYDRPNGTVKKFANDTNFESIRSSSVFAFYENERGMLISTSTGVYLLDKNYRITERYHTGGKGKFYLPNNTIVHIEEDTDKTLWLASKGGGLIHYFPKTGKFEQFTTKNGLKDNVIYACYLDDYGQIWLPSNRGLMRFDKIKKSVIHYTKANGIPHLEFNTISHYRSSDGRLFFGGLNGTISLDPKDFIPEKEGNFVRITGFKKVNYANETYLTSYAELVKSRKIILLPSDKSISLNFALSDLSDPKNQSYQYKIVGYDQQWIDLDKPEVILSNLPYGTYELLLRAHTSGKPWQYYKSPIELIVQKPFFLSWWFIALLVVALIGIFILLIKWRTSRLLKRQHELESIVNERTSEIVKQAEELKTLDQMKSQFFANISHELRTPLTLILGPLNALQEESNTSSVDGRFKKKLDVIERNAANLLGIVDEVLELSKLNAGKVELDEKEVLFKDYLKQITSSFDSTAELRKIKFRFIYHPSVKMNLLLDQKKFEKIINNLLSNAFKFTDDGGEIQIEVSEKSTTILVSVSDTGAGIDEEDLPFVFDRFYQSKSPNFTAHGGTGIGLALCYEMTKLMNGKIWAESTLGVGSRFFVEIPKKISGFSKSSKSETAKFETNAFEETWKATKKAQTILLVEDNADMREYIRSLLSGDYSILIAENGQKGLNLVESRGKEIDLIISDVMMPLMDGFTMLERLKENERWRSIPVIMLTARAAEEDKLHALTIGVDDYLTKPFSTSELQARVKNLLENYHNRKLWQQDLLHLQPATESKEIEDVESPEISQQDLIWMKKVEAIISNNIANEHFDVETLAEEMFVSKRQFERKIKKITGLSPAKIVLEVRLQQAREHLEKDTYQSVSEVSYSVGIQTPSYFSNVYTKRFGKRPSSYFK